MTITTDRVKNYNPKGVIEQREKASEYAMMAVLRYYFKDRYEQLVLSDSPDLICGKVGVEVTCACNEEEMKDTKKFSKLTSFPTNQEIIDYNKNAKSGYKIDTVLLGKKKVKRIEKSGEHIINEEKQAIVTAIKNKASKSTGYLNKVSEIELAVWFLEIPSSEMENNIIKWIDATKEAQQFKHIYVVSGRFLVSVSTVDWKADLIKVNQEDIVNIRKIGRMTAEGLLFLNDEEWN